MKKILIIGFLFSFSALAQNAQQCVKEHTAMARQNPTISYEKDTKIVSIWCECKTDQLKKGLSYEKTLEYCTASTNHEINDYLKTKGKL